MYTVPCSNNILYIRILCSYNEVVCEVIVHGMSVMFGSQSLIELLSLYSLQTMDTQKRCYFQIT